MSKIKSGFIWSAVDSIGTQTIALAITIFLAKMLGPEVYGLIAMLSIFIAIANVFINSGFSQALIRKIDRTETDLATTFYFSLAVSILCYGVLYIAAPYIAIFYNELELEMLVRVLGLMIIINSFSIIPRVLLTVNINFKSQAIATFTAVIISGSSAIYLALNGFGVWTLVIQQILSAIVTTMMLNIVSPWKPIASFCRNSFKELFGFGSKLLASGLLDTIYKNIYGLIIGKYFSASQLGFYDQANKLSSLPAMTITGVIQKVTYPMLSNIQGDLKKLDAAFLLTLQMAALFIFPIMIGISIVSEPLIRQLLGTQWIESAELLSIISIAFMLYPIHAINLNLLQVKGRSDLFLKLEVVKKFNITIMLFITVPLGIKAMCVGMVITSVLALFINTYYTEKLSSLTMLTQLSSLGGIGALALISGLCGKALGNEITTDIMKMVVSLVTALTIYLLLLIVIKRPLIKSVIHTVEK